MKEFYIIYCKDDQGCYGERDTLQQAQDRCKHLAEKNVGREYISLKAISSVKFNYENITIEEQDIG